MRSSQKTLTPAVCFWALLAACSADNAVREPKEMVDLGALVTEDLAERVWGKAALASLNFTRRNAFDVIEWEFETVGGTVTGSNAYYTLFNHGGPHVDAPNHYDFGGGLDSFSIEAFAGPLKVFGVRRFPEGYSVPPDVFDGSVSPGDVVLIFTGYTPPQTAEALPENITLTPAAAQYLVSIPVRYKIERRLGEGGMATVYLAEDIKHNAKSRSRCCDPSSPPCSGPNGSCRRSSKAGRGADNTGDQ